MIAILLFAGILRNSWQLIDFCHFSLLPSPNIQIVTIQFAVSVQIVEIHLLILAEVGQTAASWRFTQLLAVQYASAQSQQLDDDIEPGN